MPFSNRRDALPRTHGDLAYQDFLPWLANVQDVSTYLEIGVNAGELLTRMHVDNAIGVDPAFVLNCNPIAGKKNLFLFQKTSDRFFREDCKFLQHYVPDLAFLDGMHLFEYLLRDFINTEAACTRKSLIVLHDCMPLSVGMCHRNPSVSFDLVKDTPHAGMWTGDVWKVVSILQKVRPDLHIVGLDAPPTGLVCISNLDPTSRVLDDAYIDLVKEFSEVENEEAMILEMYDRLTVASARSMMRDMSHGFHFRN